MYIGEQIINPTAERLRLSSQLGATHVVIDTRPNEQLKGDDGAWDAKKVAAQRQWIEGFGLKLDVLALDVGSILLDSLYKTEAAARTVERLRKDIRAAADGGVTTLKYNLQMVGITRTGFAEGRGGVRCSAFRAADYSPEKDASFSYWGVGHPGGGAHGADISVNALGTAEAVGQVLGTQSGGVTEQQGWHAISCFLEAVLPTAEAAGVRLAGHPHDPAYPPGGLNGVNHVVGSLDGMRRFINLAPESTAHGFNFCQGTIAEMSREPTKVVLEAIKEFGPRGKIFMVHFRNIKGGYLDFAECFPDEGSVDMPACIRAYRDLGYTGILCPDHVPVSELDPARERFFAFALGYTKGLIQSA
ncbi:mannonate dehydratase [Bradyrhizobium manausense]|uniref:mannonate dehydratase n=1 Tax=Bradyrhizobium manausense TaxID=989370 RepID=UPI001BACB6D8|nr:mannonate dehydratase [Bradyrhizobium manausense]MBR0687823.1 mannonate dehydratase [Bradyrhizobium manausense]